MSDVSGIVLSVVDKPTGSKSKEKGMEITVETNWTIGELIDLEQKRVLRVNHEYQRGLRWTELQKRMFIDSVFRGYSIPAFYFHEIKVSSGPIENTFFDIVDGQQRVDAIYSFSEDAFVLLNPSEDSSFRFPNFVKSEPCPWGGLRFSELSEDLRESFRQQKLVIYQITTKNKNSIRDLFIRLQGGTPLTPQDKRDSWPGNFTEYVLKVGGKSGVDKWYGLPLFKEVAKVSNESRRRQLAAQVFMLFWTKRVYVKFCDIKSASLDEFYHAHVDFDDKSEIAKRFEKVCQVLYDAFHGKPKIVGHYLIHSFLLVDSLLEEYASGWEPRFASSWHEFETNRNKASQAEKKGEEPENPRYYNEYGRLTQTRSDDAHTIRRRHAFFSAEMLKFLSPIKLDSTRAFSQLERQSVFFRDMEFCQWCRMEKKDHKISWEECEIHHVLPHSEGGQTTIENGALVHHDCHPLASHDVEAFREWWIGADTEPEEEGESTENLDFPPESTAVKFSYGTSVHFGEIRNNKIVLTGEHQSSQYESFSAASKAVTNTSRNGWKDWELRLPGENYWVLADDWRKSTSS